MRADFWHRILDVPELVALAQGQGRLEVPPPSPAEVAEMIRKPAQAAGLIDRLQEIGERDEPDDRIGVHPAEIRLRDLLECDDDQDERRDRQEESREGRRRLPLNSRRCVVQAGRLVRREACPAERLRLVHSR